ncbi:predicted protein [Lichtheimia corymbifera JMRC:FSU:9682]|uniref:Uncharacterized protein n=1 Tax=Lichtheimia corymbifera JMRC:FSU:9682 TaxID=1263082 RepID=A0A068RJA4_9FUNG|nr:predicted protein [Lichtheimia corymbifera JMRC:FSU:9682]
MTRTTQTTLDIDWENSLGSRRLSRVEEYLLSQLRSSPASSTFTMGSMSPLHNTATVTLFHTTPAAYDDHWQAAPQRQEDGVNGKHDIGLLCHLTTLKDYVEEVVLQRQFHKA